MRRHETDWFSLSVGGLFLLVAAVYLATGAGAGHDLDLRWLLPALLMLLGAIGLIGATRAGPDRSTDGPSAPADRQSGTEEPSCDH
ncbi:MAG: hypothetical protein QOI54_502 [Actinomycetota bacterium]|nr:hypothetical protein [Actinomycetota bacterium]